jgi:hypothetical protein
MLKALTGRLGPMGGLVLGQLFIDSSSLLDITVAIIPLSYHHNLYSQARWKTEFGSVFGLMAHRLKAGGSLRGPHRRPSCDSALLFFLVVYFFYVAAVLP